MQKLQQLQHQLQANKAAELERLYATRYHKAWPEATFASIITSIPAENPGLSTWLATGPFF